MKIHDLLKSYSDITFHLPVDDGLLDTIETRLGVELDDQISALLNQTDGIDGEYGLGLLWNADKIISENIAFRKNVSFINLYMPFDYLVFIGDAGNGDNFFCPVQNKAMRRSDIFIWNHEDDSRTWVAPDVYKYLQWWLDGTIKV